MIVMPLASLLTIVFQRNTDPYPITDAMHQTIMNILMRDIPGEINKKELKLARQMIQRYHLAIEEKTHPITGVSVSEYVSSRHVTNS